jgi:hypothetical protein
MEPAHRKRRFWVPPEGKVDLSDAGFLVDPDSETGHWYNPDVVPYQVIAKKPCLYLLGEPGMGKTTALEAIYGDLKSTLADGDEALLLNLRDYSSDSRLWQRVFESEKYLAWLKGSHCLHLFLDSLDECLLRIDNVAAVLLEGFRAASVDRLSLRIACRTADRQSTLEAGLEQLWGKDRFGVYELAPLRRVDVAAEAGLNGLDGGRFVTVVQDRDAVAFAIKPITLKFLINTCKKEGAFPRTRLELYENGCLLLCDEWNPHRRDAKQAGNLSATERMGIASHIAAVTTFCNLDAVWTGPDLGDKPGADISIDEIVDGITTKKALEETLGTALFSSRGPGRLGWAHQSYAEFLGARRLCNKEVSAKRVLSLVTHPGSQGKVVPQFSETAAWLADMSPDIFRAIAATDPGVLLRSDSASARPEDRQVLVQELLKAYDEDRLVDSDWDLRRAYDKLGYSGIASTLRPYVVDSNKGLVVRRVAIDIAEANSVQDLTEDLLRIALDPSEDQHIRVQAAYAVAKVGAESARSKLRELALGKSGEDSDDELKACGLVALWPSGINAEELFAALTPPKKPNLIGLYDRFLREHVVQHLRLQDLPRALAWSSAHVSDPTGLGPIAVLVDQILKKAFENLDVPGVGERLAANLLKRLRHAGTLSSGYQQTDFRDAVAACLERRRALVETIVNLFGVGETEIFSLRLSRLIADDDLSWLIEWLEARASENIQELLAKVIARMVRADDVEGFDAVVQAARRNRFLYGELSWLFQLTDLSSAEAAAERKDYEEQQEFSRPRKPLLDPPPRVRVENALGRFESGDTNAFVGLVVRELTLEPDSSHYGDELTAELKLPGWESADAQLRSRIIAAAKRYLIDYDPEYSEWLVTGQLRYSAVAGYRALQVLAEADQANLEALPAEAWRKCAPTFLVFPVGNPDDTYRRLLSIAYAKAAETVDRHLTLLAHAENDDVGLSLRFQRIEAIWDARLEGTLVDLVREEKLRPASFATVLDALVRHHSVYGIDIARSSILAYQTHGLDCSRAVGAAVSLLLHCASAWEIVWPPVAEDAAFGLSVLSAVASRSHGAAVYKSLTEPQLCTLYIWLAQNVPYKDDRFADGAVSGREQLQWFRDGILGHLKNRGAVSEIRTAMAELQDVPRLKYDLLEAEATALQLSWQPLTVKEFTAVVGNREARLVRSGDELLKVIIESLERLCVALQGETPQAIFLWNEKPLRPKDELRLSDYVKAHLERDIRDRGTIVNREVQIRRGTGGDPGEQVDIHVDAIAKNGAAFDMVSAIIEVKGGWNDGLETDMKSQLVDRYLRENRCRCGLYLVGWYHCEQWDSEDWRKKAHTKRLREDLVAFLNEQAAGLSRDGLLVQAFVLNASLR